MSQCANQKILLRTTVFILAILPAAEGQVIHVDADAIGANDGSSWENAHNYLQDALADANSMLKPVEIRVARASTSRIRAQASCPATRWQHFSSSTA
ncbi:MAG: hypothetical protein KAY65_16540 [Planctomycetes bacterium]|nr:hypothetical protein [Planctomycetota bacterium]